MVSLMSERRLSVDQTHMNPEMKTDNEATRQTSLNVKVIN